MDSYKIIKFKANKLPEQYKPMIFSKFLRSLRQGNKYFKLIDPKAYYTVYHAYFATLLARPDTKIRFAVLSDDEDVVLGWALVEDLKLHYVFVNPENREIGIASYLLGNDAFKTTTHITNLGHSFLDSKYPDIIFNPFA